MFVNPERKREVDKGSGGDACESSVGAGRLGAAEEMQVSNAAPDLRLKAVLDTFVQSRWLWCLLAVTFVGVRQLLSGEAPPIGLKFDDTDDALRLLQIREFMAHGNWYDTQLLKIGAPEALNSHWSRLIDLPVALLISFFALFVDSASAEFAAQIVWPLALLLCLARFLVLEAERRAGVWAAIAAIVLLATCPTGMSQFLPGRIDHHNVQIVGAVVGILLLQRSLVDGRIGWLAGLMFGIGLIVGLEALPLIAVTLALACLFACFDHSARAGAANAAVALFVTLLIGFAVTSHPGQWFVVACDQLSLNLLALTGAAALASFLLRLRYADASPLVWIGGYAVAGIAGLGLYLAANPVCAGGAFAGIDPAVKTLWLDHVLEGNSLWTFAKIKPSLAIAHMTMMVLALAITISQAWRTRRTVDIFIAASTVLACIYGFYYVKFLPYGALLALVPIAAWIARLPAFDEVSARTVRIGALALLNQANVFLLAGIVIGAVSNVEAGANEKLSSGVAECTYKADIAALSKLPPGLIVTDIDLGPYIVLATHHRAQAGPYHRIHRSILDLFLLLQAPLPEAQKRLAAMNADYLVLCAAEQSATVPADETDGAKLFGRFMRTGGKLAMLEPVSIGATTGPLRAWRIRRR